MLHKLLAHPEHYKGLTYRIQFISEEEDLDTISSTDTYKVHTLIFNGLHFCVQLSGGFACSSACSFISDPDRLQPSVLCVCVTVCVQRRMQKVVFNESSLNLSSLVTKHY